MKSTITRRRLFQISSAFSAAFSCPLTGADSFYRRGINIWHMMEALTITADGTIAWPALRGSVNRMPDWQIRQLKRVGFDFVRIAISPDIFILANASNRQLLYELLQSNVARFLASGLRVIADLHPNIVVKGYMPDDLVFDEKSEIFKSYASTVTDIAIALTHFPKDRVAIELMNEPWLNTPSELARWQRIAEELHGAVRRVAPDLLIVLTGGGGTPEGLTALNPIPFVQSNVLFTFHYYRPLIFTHQNIALQTQNLIAIPWPASAGDIRKVLQRVVDYIGSKGLPPEKKARAIADAEGSLRKYFSEDSGVDQIEEDFAAVAVWANRHGIPKQRILLGEFGVERTIAQYRGARNVDRLLWLKTVRQIAEVDGYGWALWVYSGPVGMTLANQLPARTLDPSTLTALGLVPYH